MGTTPQGFTRVLLGLFLALALGGGDQASAAGPETAVYSAYLQASVYPERFDDYIDAHPDLDSPAFWRCLNDVQIGLARKFQERTGHCRDLADPEAREACLDVDETKISLLLDAIAAAITGEVAFGNTLSGQAAILSKQILGSQFFERLQRQVVAVYRPLLLCP